MNYKHIAYASLGGVVVGLLAMPYLFGYVSGSAATDLKNAAVLEANVAFYAPQCVANGATQPEVVAAVMAASTYSQRSDLQKTDLVVYPEGANPALKNAIAVACLDGLKGAPA